jgi:hypothetical protein
MISSMPESLASILPSFNNGSGEHYFNFFAFYYGGETPYWEIKRSGKSIKVIPSYDHILEDGLWQMLDFLGMPEERLEVLPEDMEPFDMLADYGWDYCTEKRQGLECFLKALNLNLTLVTYPGMDLLQAARLTERLQEAGIKIQYFALSEKLETIHKTL